MAEPDILLVEDDADFREALATSLELAGYRARTAGGVAEALRAIDADWPGLVLSDLRMPGLDG
ncbi:MAG: response regulator, partial [Sphingomonadaceae bacterium]